MISKRIARVVCWMRRLAVVVVAVAIMSVYAEAQTARWASADDPVAKEMIAKERIWVESICSTQPGLKEVFADEFQGTAPNGSRYGKAHASETDLKNLGRQCQLGEVKIQFFGDTVAVGYGNESVMHKSKDGKEHLVCLAWTDTWLKRNGKWQIIAAQDGVVECKK